MRTRANCDHCILLLQIHQRHCVSQNVLCSGCRGVERNVINSSDFPSGFQSMNKQHVRHARDPGLEWRNVIQLLIDTTMTSRARRYEINPRRAAQLNELSARAPRRIQLLHVRVVQRNHDVGGSVGHNRQTSRVNDAQALELHRIEPVSLRVNTTRNSHHAAPVVVLYAGPRRVQSVAVLIAQVVSKLMRPHIHVAVGAGGCPARRHGASWIASYDAHTQPKERMVF